MEFIDVINERYSVRGYLDKEVEDEKLDYVLKAATIAPTGVNNQPFKVYVIDTKKYKEELSEIVKRTAKYFKSSIDDVSADEIAKRSRGTPRIANRIFRRVRDFANYNNSSEIKLTETKLALDALRIDEIGLDEVDIKYLLTLKNRFGGGPVGLETIASAIGEDKSNLNRITSWSNFI